MNYEKAIKRLRQKRIGEIYWIMKEAQECDSTKKDQYCYIVHNYLLLLYLEDFKKETLKDDIKARQI